MSGFGVNTTLRRELDVSTRQRNEGFFVRDPPPSFLRSNPPSERENGATDQDARSRVLNAVHTRVDSPVLPLRSNVVESGGFVAVNDMAISNNRPASPVIDTITSVKSAFARTVRDPSPSDVAPLNPGSNRYPLSAEVTTIEVQPRPSKYVTFKDGEPPQGHESALLSVTALIQNFFRLHKDTNIGGRPWSKSEKKPGVYIDDGRKVMYLSDNSMDGQELHVSRYLYGSDKQILVAWVPDPQQPGSYIAHLFGASVSTKQVDIERHGDRYSSKYRWALSVPSGRCVLGTVYKFVRDATESTESRVDLSVSSGQDDNILSSQGHEHPAKKRKLSHDRARRPLQSESHERSTVDTESDPSFVCSSGTSAQTSVHDHPGPDQRYRHEPTAHARKQFHPNVLVLFVDSEGNLKGQVPFDECKTAKDLFEVACVRRIAFARPPEMCTRLLQVEVDGKVGILRVDNEADFEEFVSSPLEELPAERETIIVVTSYLSRSMAR